MTPDERRQTIELCREHGHTDLATWHENRLREQEKRK